MMKKSSKERQRGTQHGTQHGTKRTVFSFIVGALVALGIFFLLQSPEFFDDFQANVLSLQDREVLIEHDRDIGYKTDDYVLDVYLSEETELVDSLELEVLFDELNIFFDFEMIEKQGLLEIVGKESGRYILLIKNISDLDYNESLFVLPYTGDQGDLLVGFVTAFDTEGLPIQLSVGNLNINNIDNIDNIDGQVHRN